MPSLKVPSIFLLAAIAAVISSIVLASALAGGSPIAPQAQVATAASLPFPVDIHTEPKVKTGDATLSSPYFRLETHWMDNFGERHCEECTMVEYIPGQKGFAAAAYLSDKLYDFKGAKRVVFFAMGEGGGEKVTFSFAGKDMPADSKVPADKIFEKRQFAVKAKEVTLENDWQRFEVSLEGADLDNVKYPFAFQLTPTKDVSKVRFYLNGVTFDTEPASRPLPVEKLPTSQ
ncbi:MAG: hypothetical protein ACREAY_08250 [Nitrososphaera sp.]|uniref:hypothetical protein n=1 Tax=Nitrososphaera sp. TaxID=1971748 RepID=UPI003D6F0998